METSVPAVYMRGGTSRALFFHRRDLPPADHPHDHPAWNAIFVAALGSPDENGRQLDGMGGGISSLSKIAIIGPPTRPDADVDYTFAQVAVDRPVVGYKGNCGNISSAVGPFAVQEGMVPAGEPTTTVRIHNTNTGRIIVSRFPTPGGHVTALGDTAIDGVSGTGAEVRLSFLQPGGATTGRLLPTGQPVQVLDVPGAGRMQVSLVDAANPVVFAAAASFGLTGTEPPDRLAADAPLLARLEELRIAAAVAMGLVDHPDQARTTMRNMPLVSLVAPPTAMTTTGGRALRPDDMDVLTRMISSGQPHKATPLTAAMCMAVAARIPGSIVHQAIGAPSDADLRIAHPAGIITVAADTHLDATGAVVADNAIVIRTARRLMQGEVWLRP